MNHTDEIYFALAMLLIILLQTTRLMIGARTLYPNRWRGLTALDFLTICIATGAFLSVALNH